MKLIALDSTGRLSEQDSYLRLEDLFLLPEESVSEQTWEFVLQSDVDLRQVSFLEAVWPVLQEKFNNLVAKKQPVQKEALALWLAIFARTDFLGQNKLWQLMTDTLQAEFEFWKSELCSLLAETLVQSLAGAGTFNLRGEILQRLLPDKMEQQNLLDLWPESYHRLVEMKKLFTRRQLGSLLSILGARKALQKFSPAEFRQLKWQVYFGRDLPEAQNEQLSLLNAARQHEDPGAQLNDKELKDIWKILKGDTPDNRLTVVQYLKLDLKEESENSPALLQLLELFQDPASSNVLRFHILDALLVERPFHDPIKKKTYAGVDYLPVIELFNTNPLWRNLIMTYFSDHQKELEALRSQVSCELEALHENPEHWSAKTYQDFQKNYRQWFLEQQILEGKTSQRS